MRFFKNKTPFEKSIITSCLIGLFLILVSLIGLFFNQVGWLIGTAIGTIAEIINIILHFKGSEVVLDSKKTPLFILFYFLRMIVIVGAFLICILFDFKFHLLPFHNSIWGVVIGFFPIVICLLIGSKDDKVGKNKNE